MPYLTKQNKTKTKQKKQTKKKIGITLNFIKWFK